MKSEKKVFYFNTAFFDMMLLFDILYLCFKTPYVFKTISSLIFVIGGLVNFIFLLKAGAKNKGYKRFAVFMLIGLMFAMIGDILLIESHTFIIGAASFAIGHVLFFVGYLNLNKFNLRDLVCSLCLFAMCMLVITLYDGFVFEGIMLYVVIAYALIISLMLGKSFSNLFVKNISLSSRIIIFIGSLMFFLSDMCLLFYIFGGAAKIFDVFCLLLYYPAEFVLANSIFYAAAKRTDEMPMFKQIYCRLFQFIFRLALPILPYREPELLTSVKEIKKILKEKQICSVLLVTDNGIRSFGLTTELENDLKNSKIKLAVFDEVVPNPTITNIEDGLKIYKEKNCQAIIAFGGGSVMDCAKIIGARVVKPNQPVRKMKGLLKILKKLPLLFAVPTTAGTGSETTLAAVITDDKTHHKYPINDFCLIPKYAVLDYKTTLNLPQGLTSTTGLDALTHAVEAYIGRSTTKYTRLKAESAIKLVHGNLLECYTNGKNAKARENMLIASYDAGIAFTRSYVWYVHAVAHSLGGKYGVPHGLANAVILPYFLEFYEHKIYKKLAKLSYMLNLASNEENKKVASGKFIDWIKSLNEKMNIPTNIKELKVEDISELAVKADKEGNPLYPVPILLSAKQLEQMYKNLLPNSVAVKE